MSKPRSTNPIRLRRNANIGAADAESDELFLHNCFVETGDLDALRDPQNPQCIVLGRTGSGKTALLKHLLQSENHAFELSPEDLSLHYISNSDIINFFEAAGVPLDMFYQLLWRHVITVELLKRKFEIYNESKKQDFLNFILSGLKKNRSKERALQYLSEWGEHFWEETEYRVQEFTTQLEHQLSANAGISDGIIGLGAKGATRLTEDQRVEIINRSKQVVNKIQVKELHEVINLLSEDIFVDKQNKYFLLIDRLDENWAEDRIKHKLIKALIETVKTFRKIRPVKIIVALRQDLLDRVLTETASAGFQEEKYHSLYLPLRWSRDQIIEILDRRVNYLFEKQYTRSSIYVSDILPDNQIDRKSCIDYLLDRTFLRPREAISFINECIWKAEGSSRITVSVLRNAELSHSQKRLRSLADEWRTDYPYLLDCFQILQQVRTPFSIGDFSEDSRQQFGLTLLGTERP